MHACAQARASRDFPWGRGIGHDGPSGSRHPPHRRSAPALLGPRPQLLSVVVRPDACAVPLRRLFLAQTKLSAAGLSARRRTKPRRQDGARGGAVEPGPVGETRWLESVAAKYGLPTACVGSAALDRDDIATVLAGHAAS